jgi:hypothetical protein
MKKRNWYNFRLEFPAIRLFVILLGIAFGLGFFAANHSYQEQLGSALRERACGYDKKEGRYEVVHSKLDMFRYEEENGRYIIETLKDGVYWYYSEDVLTVIEAPAPEEVTEQSGHWFGFLLLLGGMLVIGGILVHRESFSENWYITLRRIPKYRGFYLRSKLFCVYIPGMMYLVFYALQQLDAWLCYKNLVPLKLLTKEKTAFSRFLSLESIAEVLLFVLVLGAASLLLHLVLRNIKKDIPGLLVAVAGMLIASGWFFMTEISLWMLGIVYLAVMACLVRNVYFRQ